MILGREFVRQVQKAEMKAGNLILQVIDVSANNDLGRSSREERLL